jgi:hypothetical protein
MRLFTRLVGLLLVLVLLLAGIAFVLPDRVHVERSITIARPKSQVHLLLTQLRRFNEWSPWFARDPAASYTFSGPDSGVGATLAWVSRQHDVGTGSQTIAAVVPDESVTMDLDFGVRGKSVARFDLRTESGETRVTWNLDSELPLHLDQRFGWNAVGRYMGLFMDRLVGADFEQGLSNLKQIVDGFPNIDIAGIAPQIADLPARKLIYTDLGEEIDDAATRRSWETGLALLTRFAAQHGLTVRGGPLTVTRLRDADAGLAELALPAHYDVMPDDTDVRGHELPATRAAILEHNGSGAERRKRVEQLRAWMQVKGLPAGDLLIEEYADGANVLQGGVRIAIPLRAASAP